MLVAILLQAIIEDERPDLKGCTVEYMRFDYQLAAFEVGVSHGSLNEVPPLGVRPRIDISYKREIAAPVEDRVS
jgi:hypothetical protein